MYNFSLLETHKDLKMTNGARNLGQGQVTMSDSRLPKRSYIPDLTETFIKSWAALSLKRSNRIGLPLFVIQGIFHKTVISILTNYRSLKMSVWGFGHVRLGILFHKDISVIIGFITTDAANLRFFEVSQLV